MAENLAGHAELTRAEAELLEDVTTRTIRSVGPRTDIIREGDTPDTVKVVLEGCTFVDVAGGR